MTETQLYLDTDDFATKLELILPPQGEHGLFFDLFEKEDLCNMVLNGEHTSKAMHEEKYIRATYSTGFTSTDRHVVEHTDAIKALVEYWTERETDENLADWEREVAEFMVAYYKLLLVALAPTEENLATVETLQQKAHDMVEQLFPHSIHRRSE